MSDLHVYEVTYETKEGAGAWQHKKKVLAENAEEACKLAKARAKRLDGKRAYKLKATLMETSGQEK